MLQIPQPMFIGFRAKNVTAPSGFEAPEVCSMSDCVNDPPPGWEKRWDWNRASCYNTEEDAVNTIPPGHREKYALLAYRMYPLEFSRKESHIIDLNARLSLGEEIAPEPDISEYQIIGYDVANGPIYELEIFDEYPGDQYAGRLGFGCSPLSCNGCSHEFPVNAYYLLNDLDTAIEAATVFGTEEPEPGPFYIYQILRKHAGPAE